MASGPVCLSGGGSSIGTIFFRVPSTRWRTRLTMAALLKLVRSGIHPLLLAAIREQLRSAILVAGEEKGLLRRDVMRCRRRRRFFFPIIRLPSTSHNGRRLLSEYVVVPMALVAAKQYLMGDGAENVNLKLSSLVGMQLPKVRTAVPITWWQKLDFICWCKSGNLGSFYRIVLISSTNFNTRSLSLIGVVPYSQRHLIVTRVDARTVVKC